MRTPSLSEGDDCRVKGGRKCSEEETKKKQEKKRGFRSFLGLFASGVVVDSGASRLHRKSLSVHKVQRRKQRRRGYLRIEPETVEGQLDVSWSHYSTFKEKFSYPLLFQVVET